MQALSTTIAFVLLITLFACGGTARSAFTESAPSAVPTNSTSGDASASGVVLDNLTNDPLAGVTVAVAPGPSARSVAPRAVATTGPDGGFLFTASPGSYLLIIGNNSSTDSRSTYHGRIDLSAGTNRLVMGRPSPEPAVVLTAAQQSGSFRLTLLSPVQVDCLDSANAGRTKFSLPPLVSDEALQETADAIVDEALSQQTDVPAPLYEESGAFEATLVTGLTTSTGFSSCSAWTGINYSYVNSYPPYAYATARRNIYYGAAFQMSSQSARSFGAQLWGEDPRPFYIY